MKSGVLFITYDGLLDPLGASQILPYIYGIAQHRRVLHILSFEKPERLAADAESLHACLAQQGIGWTPISFTSRFGILGKLWDLGRMCFWGLWLTVSKCIKIIHARGHPPAQIGLFVKRLFGVSLIFDFRGLWVDERVDKGGWDMARSFHRLQYWYFKRKERKLLAGADQVVVLTDAVVDEVIKLGKVLTTSITVIPCCADFEQFPLSTAQRRQIARELCGLATEGLVLGYLGSVGRMYMLDRFFRLFELAAENDPDINALLITQDILELTAIMNFSLQPALRERVVIRSGNRSEVASLIPAMDICVSFIQPSYARMASSPTKLAECFAEGIPAICNPGVGDIVEQMRILEGGVIVNAESDEGLRVAIGQFEYILARGGERLRTESRKIFGLEVAADRYQSVYSKLE